MVVINSLNSSKIHCPICAAFWLIAPVIAIAGADEMSQTPAVRFQAECSNECWHFDLSPSDLKHVKAPAWMDPERGRPLLMLYSVVDDRSGVEDSLCEHAAIGLIEMAAPPIFMLPSPRCCWGKDRDFVRDIRSRTKGQSFPCPFWASDQSYKYD